MFMHNTFNMCTDKVHFRPYLLTYVSFDRLRLSALSQQRASRAQVPHDTSLKAAARYEALLASC